MIIAKIILVVSESLTSLLPSGIYSNIPAAKKQVRVGMPQYSWYSGGCPLTRQNK